MRKKTLVSILLTAAMACSLLAGCSSPTKETSDSGTKNEKSSDDSATTAGTREAATIVGADKLPVTGIGAQIASDVKAKKDYKIGYIAKNTTNPYMVAQAEGVKKAGEDMGFNAVTQAPSTADSVEEQVKIMEDMIQQEMDVIIVHCADSNGIMPGVRKAQEAGIIVLTIGTPASEDTFLRTGVDYKETGTTIATEMAEALNGKGNIIILEGPPGAANAIERLEGINEAFEKYPDIKVVASQTANFKRTEGMSVTENLLQKYTDVQGIIGMNDESALGAIQALKAAGMTDVLVAGFDGSTDATSAVETGDMFATYNTDPYGSGYIACAYAVNYLNDGTEPEGKFIPFPTAANDPLITAGTVQDYKDNIAWWKVIQ
ncbi:sugar ABC transporter substrate-binding protein [Bariatricus massiliensis]|uniref:Sugar ABC transporter substrate-binding protein n=1 Tax=Bariatricus massiliensis TaxID=1745713 RepID=A0ABS8DGH2_9FIRM|nr:sugar ABC transporter substrate-binding protein [Bariatricus massiliensis]MCB7304393.1 sugar ABC transporter substrate-binding protein [Bariatricus massiliensis]MCB7375044.1 sugar ABC transporter substrate-binding protein [Bariatricus massiliensis]MCB7387503.1 sugar ABC transporter substrate-binding protein [Bariatricus massiliensis]MCB7411665.1 sugar ABC transporter substrate-binding protein [Bariatricus massiliensis]MCQ5253800.1 sugar ABC transporter substrate-binding protein [Bariatricus